MNYMSNGELKNKQTKNLKIIKPVKVDSLNAQNLNCFKLIFFFMSAG